MNDINIVPQPVETKKTEGEFKLDKKTCILSHVDDKAANMLNFYLEKLYGFTLPIKKLFKKMKSIFSFHRYMLKAITRRRIQPKDSQK